MIIAVTGATGFVGRNLVATLVQRGHRVSALVRTPRRARVIPADDVDIVSGSLAEGAALIELCRGVDPVALLVASIAESPGASCSAVHVDGTRGLMDAARSSGLGRVVYMSAVGARPDPRAAAYHRTKWRAEELVRGSGLAAVIL